MSKTEELKKKLKQKSTWEGIAVLLGAIGVTIEPELIVEIVGGVFAVIGTIEIMKNEPEEKPKLEE